ncbi:MAG TPA: hypothetical protein VK983_00705 [Candidatus Limnocylindrales bacterium]|nr:hypothetical protein [Candidatus Limnocylindrales bacterium]
MDPASVNDTVSLVQNVIKLGKRATNLQYEEALLAARETIFSLREENQSLKEANSALREQVKNKIEFILEDSVYWSVEDTAKKQPFCPACYADGKIMPLEPRRQNTKQTSFRCPLNTAHHSNPYDYHPQAVVRSSKSNRRSSITGY